tara:strand:- start:187 stop:903 length:717 start_codon:yes stop_codon:yes gene_type:complete
MPEDNRRREGTPGSANPNECYTCLGPVDHWHHVVPYSLGGDITLPLCNNCHGKIHGKDLLNMKALQRKALQEQKRRGVLHSPQNVSKQSKDVIRRIEKMVKDGLSNSAIAKLFIANGTWPMPKDFEGKWINRVDYKCGKKWFTPEARWLNHCLSKVSRALKSAQVEREYAENRFWYELSLKPEGERSAWMPDYEPVTRGSNLPSLFTETLQPTFDLKTTATPGTWNLSQWAWDAKQDT